MTFPTWVPGQQIQRPQIGAGAGGVAPGGGGVPLGSLGAPGGLGSPAFPGFNAGPAAAAPRPPQAPNPYLQPTKPPPAPAPAAPTGGLALDPQLLMALAGSLPRTIELTSALQSALGGSQDPSVQLFLRGLTRSPSQSE